MANQTVFTLINPQNGNLAFKLFYFDGSHYFNSIQRNNYFSLIYITKGNGKIRADFSEYDFQQDTLFSFSPYQPYVFSSSNLQGVAIHFHSDFFCIHKHQPEIACSVLFNNIYQPPFVFIDESTAATLKILFEQMKIEIQNEALAQYELLVSYLKIFLITATRLKIEQQPFTQKEVQGLKEPFIIQNLIYSIEKEFKTKHSPRDYANTLNISAKALAKITKTYFNKTITALISERIIIEAKRELYLTNKTVKEIAYELGYQDEYYFSRFFKTNTDISPQLYRETVGFERGI